MLAAIEPGTGRVQALAANRNFSSTTEDQEPAHRPGQGRQGIKGTYPNTTNPLLTGGGDITGYQAGSAFKIFTMVAALEKGYPLDYTSSTRAVQVEVHRRPTTPRACGAHWCPSNASQLDERPAQHVDRLRQVGQHLLRAAARAGRRGEGGRGGQAARHPVPQRRTTERRVEFARGPGRRVRSPWASPTTPLELANAYATLAADGMYCEPTPVSRSATSRATSSDVGNPQCKQAHARGGPGADRRRALPGRRPRRRQLQRRRPSNRGRRQRRDRGSGGRHPVSGKTGTTDDELDRTSPSPPSSSRSPTPGRPGLRQTAKMSHNGTSTRPVHTMRDAMKGKPSDPVHQATAEDGRRHQVGIPNVACKSVDAARTSPAERRLRGRRLDREGRLGLPGGHRRRHRPRAARTIKGGVVLILVSNGIGPAGRRPVGRGSPARHGTIRPPLPRHRPRSGEGGPRGGPFARRGRRDRSAGELRRTSAATWPPSARPATAAWAAFIAGPICAIAVKPPSASAPRPARRSPRRRAGRQVAARSPPRRAPCAA